MSPTSDRLDRLASEAKGGGGLALPLFFAALLTELLDNGPTGTGRMVTVVSGVGSNKTQKLEETWNGSWEFLTTDLMEQLLAKGLVARDDESGGWRIGEKFVPGVKLETVPYRKGLNRSSKVIVWPKDEREARRRTAQIESQAEEIIASPHDIAFPHVLMNALRESYDRQGPISKAVKDGNGRIIDGRRRLKVDPGWPTMVLCGADGKEVRTNAEVLRAMKSLMNDFGCGQHLTSGQVDRIDKILEELPADSMPEPPDDPVLRAVMEWDDMDPETRPWDIQKFVFDQTGLSIPESIRFDRLTVCGRAWQRKQARDGVTPRRMVEVDPERYAEVLDVLYEKKVAKVKLPAEQVEKDLSLRAVVKFFLDNTGFLMSHGQILSGYVH